MRDYILDYPGVYLIYGRPRSGKSTIVREIYNNLEWDKIMVISNGASYNTSDIEYDIERVDEFVNSEGKKILILDDFMHIDTSTGIVARHLKGVVTTTRHKDLNIIFSTHSMSIGPYIRLNAGVLISTVIDAAFLDCCKDVWGLDKKEIKEKYKNTIEENKYSFLILGLNIDKETVLRIS
jgi:AAA+ ATPase superfamily predicted ATPase